LAAAPAASWFPGTCGIADHFQDFVELAPYVQDELRFVSRFTGAPCPHFWPDGSERWTESYYPTQAAHEQAFAALLPVLERRLTPAVTPG
jgi:hypothetical protein